MVLSIVFYIKIANIYPETNRDRTLIVTRGLEKSKTTDGYHATAMLSSNVIETCFKPLESAEAVTAEYKAWGEDSYVQPDGSKEQLEISVKYVDDKFWTVFSFRFLNGKPFTEADFSSAIPTAVIAESLAKRLFGTVEAEGKYVSLNFRQLRVSGVVKDASYVTDRSYAQLWVPYTIHPNHKIGFGSGGSLGMMSAYILAPSAGDLERVKEEAIANIQKYGQTLDKVEFSVNGQPDRQWQSLFRDDSTLDFDKILLQYLFVFLILLLVPAVSLSGMTDSRMERRLSEIGVRRAFGAPIGTTMMQIITENLLFSLIGGFIGLLFSYLIILLGRSWIMEFGGTVMDRTIEGMEVTFSPAMLMNFTIFAIALGICFVLNLLSALIPAWRYSHREIIHSLNAKL
jgi:putative ABC transport system permease protein